MGFSKVQAPAPSSHVAPPTPPRQNAETIDIGVGTGSTRGRSQSIEVEEPQRSISLVKTTVARSDNESSYQNRYPVRLSDNLCLHKFM